MEANEKSLTELSLSTSSYDAIAAAASQELAASQDLNDEPLVVSEESDYHRVARGCPKGFTQQCGTGYRT
jgi:hypothetical protein